MRGCFAILLIIVLLSATAHAQQQGWTFNDIHIADRTSVPEETSFGYVEHAFAITNHSPDQPRRITLAAPAYESGSMHRIGRLTRTVEVPAGSSARISVLQPPLPLGGWDFSVTIDGTRQRETLATRASRGGYYHAWGTNPRKVHLLTTQGATRVHGSRHQDNRGEFFINSSDAPLSAWSRDWLSYTTYAAIVLTAREWEAAPGDLQSALLDYTRAGGVLCLLGDVDIIAELGASAESFGSGETAYHGFGRLLRFDADRLEYQLVDEHARHLLDEAYETHRALSRRQNAQAANTAFPVVDDTSVPVRGLFALLIVFALVAGPLNLVVITRKRRRIWLLWTTPVISLLFCGSVFGYMLYMDGVTPTVRVGTVTVLDQERREAATLGWIGYYAPLTPRDGLRFDDRSELTLQAVDGSGDSGHPRTVRWSGREQHLARGWVTAGVPAHFRVRRVSTDRRRLQVDRDDAGEPILVNRLEVVIDHVYFLDTDGSLYRAGRLADGEAATAERAEIAGWDGEPRADRARRIFRTNWNASPALTSWYLADALRPGGYVAITEASPFVDPSLGRHHRRDHPNVVIGRLGAADLAARPRVGSSEAHTGDAEPSARPQPDAASLHTTSPRGAS